jgi:hypothetical protein
MVIPGIPDDQLERLHWYLGPGKGNEYAYRHIPSGIMVGGTCPPQMKILQFDQQLIAELKEKLTVAGIIKSTETDGE